MSGTALSIQQPWAWLIVHGHKPLENRRWNTRYRGRFFVHASKSFDRDGYEWVVRSGLAPVDLPSPSSFERGGICGAVTLVRVDAPQAGNYQDPWRDPEQFAFILSDPVHLPFRAVRGQLGFFRFQ